MKPWHQLGRFLVLVVCVLGVSRGFPADIPGVAPGIPEPQQRNVIVQLFDWRFADITAVLPRLKQLGYSHVLVSPPQKSNERDTHWRFRYQPIDFSTISGPLGNEDAFKGMIEVAHQHGISVLVDAVLNHTIDLTEPPSPGFVVMDGDRVVSEQFPQFEPSDFHRRRNCNGEVIDCWLCNNLLDLRTETDRVRNVAKQYLAKLVGLGADGFRFDAAKHIEPVFFPALMSAAPGKYAFGEIIAGSAKDLQAHLAFQDMDFYDFPLVAAMRQAFAPGGDLQTLKNAQAAGRALPGPRAVTFVRNHDIDRGQVPDRGIDDRGGRDTFGIGWNENDWKLERPDVLLAYAFILGREDGLPYVFVDMPTLKETEKDDRFDDPDVVAGIRFHNLCLAGQGGVARREDIWQIQDSPNVLGWQRGLDRFVVINKDASPFPIRDRVTTLQPGEYKEVRNGWRLDVGPGGRIAHWDVPGRTAVRFVRIGP